MRIRTLLAITFTLFALPAVAAEVPAMPTPRELPTVSAPTTGACDAQGCPDVSVCFEVRILKVPAGFDFRERSGVALNGEVVLSDAELRRLLEAAQAHRDVNVMQMPKITVADGQTARLHSCETRHFATGVEAVRVKGQTVLVPKNTPVELGDSAIITGSITADGKGVRVHGKFTRTRVEGNVELVPVVTQITPVFEGGSQGKPIPFTQYLQVPDVRTEKAEKTTTVPADGTFVLGGWKETAEAPADRLGRGRGLLKGLLKPAEYDVIALATVRIIRAENVAPMPRETQANKRVVHKYKLRNVAAADAARAVNVYLQGKNLTARVTEEPEFNNVVVSAAPAIQQQIGELLAALDKAPTQVMVQAMVVKVPRGFVARSGLNVGSDSATTWTLSPRETHMLTGLLRAEKERGECDVLSRPQLCVRDGQTGIVQVGQQYLVPAAAEVKLVAWKVAVEPKIAFMQSGFSLQVTPTVSSDGKSVGLNAVAKFTSLPADPSQLTGVAFTDHTVRVGADLPAGNTLVFASSAGDGRRSFSGALQCLCGGDAYRTLVILTPHIVRVESDNARILAEEASRRK